MLAARVSLPWAPREQHRRDAAAAQADRGRHEWRSRSGVASTLPWPIADEPTARSSPISSAAGIVERAAPTGPGSSLKPKRSAVSTSRRAPTFAPSGANTELQDCANELLQRAAARLAVGVLELHALERGRGLDREARARPDLAGLQRGGQRDDLERRAGRLGRRERDAGEREHLAGLGPQHGDAAEAPGQRLDRRALDVRVDRACARRRRPAACARATTRFPACSTPPGVPVSRASNSRSRPVSPTGAPSGTPRCASSAARSGGAGPTRPATSAASGPRSDRRSGPLASGVPSRARIVAAVAERRLARQLLAAAQAGEDELGAPVDRLAVHLVDHRQPDGAAQAAEDPRLHRDRQVVGAVLALVRLGDPELAERDRLARLAVGAHEALEARALARAVGEQPVHLRVVPALPRGRPLARHARRGRLVLRAQISAHAEGDERRRGQRCEALGSRALAPGARRRPGGGRRGHQSSMPERPNREAEMAPPVASRT